MSEHTKLPWKALKRNGNGSYVLAEDGTIIIEQTTRSDAAFIVRACNSHEALVEALKKIHHESCLMDDLNSPMLQRNKIQLLAEAALAKVSQ